MEIEWFVLYPKKFQWSFLKKSKKFSTVPYKTVPYKPILSVHTYIPNFRDAIRIATEQFRQELTEEITQKIFEGTMGNMELTDGNLENLELPEWEIGENQ